MTFAGPMEFSGVFTFFIVVISSSYLEAADYCNISSCTDKSSHTLCKFINSGPAGKCLAGGNLGGAITASDKNLIVKRHNQLRRRVANGQETEGSPGPQPAARSMPHLQWDDELAMIAQRWADQCDYGHDTCRNVDRYQVGQNIAKMLITGDTSDLSLQSMVDMWYDEVKDYNSKDVGSFNGLYASNGEQIGDYTQFVWAKTTRIGCGARKFAKGDKNYYYVVCNYGPAGNFLGQSVYETR
ncbi:hypothetical protein QAD02_010635 [Eretmocerus hayati]|uniref:Uncharacterized protein n=1 Tax=Eretmocerus hayati TaxID=131215 RepID=A0ACC2NUS2_9HYME|nr:hypothetical protein QAD02_010635 [Eretmocerus hayati]